MFQKLAIGNQGLDGFFFTDGYAILGLVIDPAPAVPNKGDPTFLVFGPAKGKPSFRWVSDRVAKFYKIPRAPGIRRWSKT